MKLTALIIAVAVLSSCAFIDSNNGDAESSRAGTQGSSASPLNNKNNGTLGQSKQLNINQLKEAQQDIAAAQVPENKGDISEAEISLAKLKKANGHSSAVRDIFMAASASSSRTEQLLSVDQSGRVLLWNVGQTSLQSYDILELRPAFTSLAFSPKTMRLAVAYPSAIEIYSLKSGTIEYELKSMRTRVPSMDFEPSGESLVLGGADGVVYRWRFEFEAKAEKIIDREKSLERYIGHSTVMSMVRTHPFGRVFISADWYGGLSAWLTYDSDRQAGEFDRNVFEGRMFSQETNRVRSSRRATSIIEGGFFTKDGQFLFVAAEDGLIEVWQVRGFKQVALIQAHKGSIYALAQSPVDNQFASLGRDGHLKTWKLENEPANVTGILNYKITPMKDFEMPQLRKLVYQDSNTLLASDLNGSIVRIDINNTEQ